MAYANVQDVADRLGRPITDAAEIKQVNAWISDVELIIKARIRDLDELVAGGEIDPDILTSVIAGVVVRKVLNPEGYRSTTRSLDGWSETQTRDREISDGALRLTDDEWALLIPVNTSGAFTISPHGRPRPRHWYADGPWFL